MGSKILPSNHRLEEESSLYLNYTQAPTTMSQRVFEIIPSIWETRRTTDGMGNCGRQNDVGSWKKDSINENFWKAIVERCVDLPAFGFRLWLLVLGVQSGCAPRKQEMMLGSSQ